MTLHHKRNPGRPGSGKKAYCIRMRPDVYQILRDAAKQDGYTCLGDWFEFAAKVKTNTDEGTSAPSASSLT